MAVSKKWFLASLAVLFLFLVGAMATVQTNKDSSTVEIGKLQNSKNSTMATRSEEVKALNEHAVADPEAVAAEVDTIIDM
ncbi:putative pectate lyase 1 [Gossypium australe]|uniref:Putative pectate lyase 1 n=1 Tax=Gossypium australe TaxID=47621 RepID=A0A5B6WI72_9ROSI|nr:putative pectate lyase 1 [Gossypium australe]